ncbi:hypothetical protein [Domibacillus mangrovi]|nr:hypothetical protein [Domibacillus mangrovi]
MITYLKNEKKNMIALLEKLVNTDSPSYNKLLCKSLLFLHL